MILTLEITSPKSANLGGASRQTFDHAGGSLGRDTDNSWVLPHPKVSAHHALITWRDGVFYIEDDSTNGICVNSTKNRLGRNRPYALKPGDYLLIDPYEIRVSVTGDARGRTGFSDDSDPFEPDDPFAASVAASGQAFADGNAGSETVDPLKLLGANPNAAPKRAPKPRAKDLERASPMEEHFQPPAAIHDPALPPPPSRLSIPENYNPLADDPPAVRRPPPRPPRAVPHAPAPPPMAIPENYDPLAPDARPSSVQQAAAPARSMPDIPAPPPAVAIPAGYDPLAPDEGLPSVPDVVSDSFAAHQATPGGDPVESERSAFLPKNVTSEQSAFDRPPGPSSVPIVDPAPDLAADEGTRAGFGHVLAGAGLDPNAVTSEMASDFGRILRVVVAGVMDVLRSRQQIKDEFRMRMTRFKPAENNPLKFSANVDDALHNLLIKRNPAYLPAVEAFEDAFADLRDHQIAMLAGMRVAFESMLAEFDPDRLQQEFDRLNKGLVPAKLRYWELFRDKRDEIAKDPETAFRKLFGEEFAKAYEDQLRDLKAQQRSMRKAASGTPTPSDT